LASSDGSHDGAPTKNVRKRTKPHKAGVLALHLAGCTNLAPAKIGACEWGKDEAHLNTNPRAEMSRHYGLRAPALEENKCRIVSVCAAALHSDTSVHALRHKSPDPD
jgi:hypothetical protein